MFKFGELPKPFQRSKEEKERRVLLEQQEEKTSSEIAELHSLEQEMNAQKARITFAEEALQQESDC